LSLSETGKPPRLIVQAVSGVPQPNGRNGEDNGKNAGDQRGERFNPRWPINPLALFWGGLIGGMLVFGLGYDLLAYGHRYVWGGLIALSGLSLSAYALFWPLLYGGY
jgi:hypothetical protein